MGWLFSYTHPDNPIINNKVFAIKQMNLLPHRMIKRSYILLLEKNGAVIAEYKIRLLKKMFKQ
jgi:hypothetical protein